MSSLNVLIALIAHTDTLHVIRDSYFPASSRSSYQRDTLASLLVALPLLDLMF
jgi:hypothetical protein